MKIVFTKDDLAVMVTCFTEKGWTGTLNPLDYSTWDILQELEGVQLKVKLHLFDLLWICCTTSCTTSPQQVHNKSNKWSLTFKTPLGQFTNATRSTVYMGNDADDSSQPGHS